MLWIGATFGTAGKRVKGFMMQEFWEREISMIPATVGSTAKAFVFIRAAWIPYFLWASSLA
jgi:hypothetical protein